MMMKAREKPKPNMKADSCFPLATVRKQRSAVRSRQQSEPKPTVAALTEDRDEDGVRHNAELQQPGRSSILLGEKAGEGARGLRHP